MEHLPKFKADAIQMAHSLPNNTVIIVAKVSNSVLYSVRQGNDIPKIEKDIPEVLSLFHHDPEDNK